MKNPPTLTKNEKKKVKVYNINKKRNLKLFHLLNYHKYSNLALFLIF